ncbi:MAG: hypothetical protein ACJAZO_003779 [Myxococcota bacterium]|jgi:hypothetical protein
MVKPLLSCILLTSCGSANVVEPLPANELLTRLSLDIRGVRPSADEYERVLDDPEAIEVLVDDYLQDPGFGPRVMDLWSEVYLTRSEGYEVGPDSFSVTAAAFYSSIGEEPLRILERVATEDLPYTDVVTADWTMANPTTASLWQTDYPTAQTGWQPAQYTDGRPHSGILTTNGMWWRYGSTDSNANRKRANQVSRIFLCNDYLVRPIDFDRNVNLLDQDAVEDALRTNPGCVNCHVSLDPLASYFWGFYYVDSESAVDTVPYHPEREAQWRTRTGVAPGFYGEPGYTLADLGQQIAADNRFPECAVQQTWELFLRRDAAELDAQSLSRHRDAFLSDGMTLRSLIRSVVDSPEYRSGPTDEAGYVPRKMATAALLSSQIEGLTGFTWTRNGIDVMSSDRVGFQTLAGAPDGDTVTASSRIPNATLLLVQERLAEAAATTVARQDQEDPANARLFERIDFTETPDTDRTVMVEQVQDLHLAVYGRRIAPDGPETDANLALWSELYGVTHDTKTAWAGVLAVLLRDPDFLFY